MTFTFKVFSLCSFLLLLHSVAAEEEPRFFINQDWQTAGQLMGMDTSQGVASFITSAMTQQFSDKQDSDPQQQPSQSLFHGFFRLLGFDTSKLNAIAVNAVVFIAKMVVVIDIGSSLIRNFSSTGPERNLEEDQISEENPLSWILDDVKSQARSLLSQAQDGDLPEQLIASLQSVPGETDCIQLLVCRASPLLAGMQRSLRHLLDNTSTSTSDSEWRSLSPLQRMYRDLPARSEFLDAASTCGRRLPSCGQLFDAL